MAKPIVFLLLLIVSPAAYAVTHTVGDSNGWTNGVVNYDNWASGVTFATGDTLVFNYDFTHAVDEVTPANYRSCSTGNPISSDSNSPTTITLSDVGMRYFVCPRSNHCSQGMKLAINVTAASTSPGTPSPPSSGTPSPPSSGTTPSSTPPPPSGGATSLGGRNSFIVGFLLVSAAMLMG